MITEKQGLCMNCANSQDCALVSIITAALGVRFCEEYETVQLAADASSPERTSPGSIPRTHSGMLGLCGNCDHYPGCTYPKPAAGVWHCEDYR
jgi:hypothetical protein